MLSAPLLRAENPPPTPPYLGEVISRPLDDRGVEWCGEKAVDLVTGVLPKGWALGYSRSRCWKSGLGKHAHRIRRGKIDPWRDPVRCAFPSSHRFHRDAR